MLYILCILKRAEKCLTLKFLAVSSGAAREVEQYEENVSSDEAAGSTTAGE